MTSRSGAVHPHACGEHELSMKGLFVLLGSSPRMWGTPGSGPRGLPRTRFIPTHVGNTAGGVARHAEKSVHPHACGEHGYIHLSRKESKGSSPRMWGTRDKLESLQVTGRFIPTHVGNTCSMRLSGYGTSVHPHACGEHFVLRLAGFLDFGSSPRMWGTPYKARLIPGGLPVHPHACGEHLYHVTPHSAGVGSSPRMWGTRGIIPESDPHSRFIPTHVGNTCSCGSPRSTCSVHPHACGEHYNRPDGDPESAGSSPRMWGTLCPNNI